MTSCTASLLHRRRRAVRDEHERLDVAAVGAGRAVAAPLAAGMGNAVRHGRVPTDDTWDSLAPHTPWHASRGG